MKKLFALVLSSLLLAVLGWVFWYGYIGQYLDADVIPASEVTLGDYAALKTKHGWACYQLQNHVGRLVWVRREIEITDLGKEN